MKSCSREQDSNLRPLACRASALPTKLPEQRLNITHFGIQTGQEIRHNLPNGLAATDYQSH